MNKFSLKFITYDYLQEKKKKTVVQEKNDCLNTHIRWLRLKIWLNGWLISETIKFTYPSDLFKSANETLKNQKDNLFSHKSFL